MFTRIIPRLDIKGPNLIKGICFEGLRSLGNPNHYAQKYFLDGADELIINDIVASLYGRDNIKSVLKDTSKNIFIPITAGGGVRSLSDAKELLKSGADKIMVNTAALIKPELINYLADNLGSSTICANIEAKKIKNDFFCYYNFGRDNSGKKVEDWIHEIQVRGIGEICITSIDNDGNKSGLNFELFSRIKKNCKLNVPTIFGGGIGKPEHIYEFLKKNQINGVTLSSILHYSNLDKSNRNSSLEGNKFFLDKMINPKKKISIKSIKRLLKKKKIKIRV